MQEASGSLRAQTGGRYSGPHGSCALVNWDVIRSISMMSDVSTRSKLCFLRRDWRADLQNLLFSHIEIALTSQLDAFLRCVEDSETTRKYFQYERVPGTMLELKKSRIDAFGLCSS